MVKKIVLISIVCLVWVELVLRYCFGFCDALLYNSSDEYEYIAQPNQVRYRFGSNIYYNSYSQRSKEVDTTKSVVLGLGDSILFGGTWMDQDSLATSLFSKETGVQMLNISAGSWGPDNCAAYLEHHGTFGAKAIILVCSSHDAYDVMSFEKVVGIAPNYPEKQHVVAIVELVERYMWPRIRPYFSKTLKKHVDPDEKIVLKATSSVKKKSNIFNSGFGNLKMISDSLQVPFFIYLHAEKVELENNEYNDMGKKIIEWANQNGVQIIEGLKVGEKTYMYKDVIHYNEKGQRFLADQMVNILDGYTE